LNAKYLSTQIKTPNLDCLGVMLDADTKPMGRYRRLRNICLEYFPSLPEELPQGGLVVSNADGLRFGVWIMPDNVSEGGLEIFLRNLVPQSSERLWQHAMHSVESARQMGAPCRDVH